MRVKGDNFFMIIRNYLTVYLPVQRCFSAHTIKSYKDTLNLLLDYLQKKQGLKLNQITFEIFNAALVRAFIEWLRSERSCGVSSQNQRLAALKSFFKYAGIMEPSCLSIQIEVAQIPMKKTSSAVVGFMSEPALQAILKQPSMKNSRGLRDTFFMVLMYDTAARLSELLSLRVKHIRIQPKTSTVSLMGKGSKARLVPIMDKTAEHFQQYLKVFHPAETRNEDDLLFFTVIHGAKQPMSPDTVASFVRKYGEKAKCECPETPDKVHPHQFRHTRAIHLYRNGMPMTLLSEFLGHANYNTTQIYAYADTEMKRAAIRKAENRNPAIASVQPIWSIEDEDMMRKLYGLK